MNLPNSSNKKNEAVLEKSPPNSRKGSEAIDFKIRQLDSLRPVNIDGPLIENFEEVDEGLILKTDLDLFNFFDSDDENRENKITYSSD